jgi:hypothetical protein
MRHCDPNEFLLPARRDCDPSVVLEFAVARITVAVAIIA